MRRATSDVRRATFDVRRATCNVLAIVLGWGVGAAPVAEAHTGSHSLLGEALGRWTWEPVTVTLLAISGLLYGGGLHKLWSRAGRGRGITAWQAASFALGLASLGMALLSPLAWLSEVLFSAHMTQHELLMLVAAPLLCLGRPLVATLWAVPASWHPAIRRFTHGTAVTTTWRGLTAPLAVFLLHGVTIWAWHVPVLYEAALHSTGVHIVQHLSFVLTAALFWWGMMHGRYGRIGYGVAVLYVFLTAVHSSILGALLTVAPSLWYPTYGTTAATWRVDALADQQLAGLLMWVPAGVVFMALGLALFAAWLGEAERRAALGTVAGRVPSAGAHDAS